MATISVGWTEARTYYANVEIEDFDPDNNPDQQVRAAIGELDDLEDYELAADEPLTAMDYHVVTEGDES